MGNSTRSIDLEALLARSSWVHGLARRLVADESRADDLVQEVWRAALTSRGVTGPLESWVRGVARNVLSNERRSHQHRGGRERRAARPEGVPSSAELVERAELQRMLALALERLPEIYRDALILRFYEDEPPRRIARRLGIPVETARTRVARGLDRLRQQLDAEHGDRRAWCLPLVPLAASREGALLGSGALTGAAAQIALILLLVTAGLVAFRAWPRDEEPRSVESAVLSSAAGQEGDKAASRVTAPIDTAENEGLREVARAAVPAADPSAGPILRVLVLSEGTRQPLAGVEVGARVTSLASSLHGVRFPPADDRPRTREDGLAELRVPAGERLSLNAWGWGVGAGGDSVTVPPLGADETRLVELHVPTGTDLDFWGRLLDPHGAPVPHHEVLLLRTDATIAGDAPAWLPGAYHYPQDRATTDAEGHFHLRAASWNSPLGWVAVDGLAPRAFELVHGHEVAASAKEIRLAPFASLRGFVRAPRGVDPAELTVRLSTQVWQWHRPSPERVSDWPELERQASVGRDGAFAFEDLPPGVPLRSAVLRNGEPVEPGRARAPIVLEPAEERTLELALGGDGLVTGVALDPTGRPVASLTVQIAAPAGTRSALFDDEPAYATARTDEHGRFELRGVPAGTWWIGPQPRDDETAEAERPVPSITEVEVDEGGRTSVTLTVHRGLYLRGKVLLPDGSAATRVAVAAHAGDRHHNTTTDPSGEFRLGPLVEGTYTVRAHALNGGMAGPSNPVEARAGTEDLVLNMTEGGRMAGRVVDARTGGGVEAQVLFVEQGAGEPQFWMTSSRRRFERSGLPAGRYDVLASTEDAWGALFDVVLEPGQIVEDLRIELRSGASLQLSMRAAGHGWRVESGGRLLAVGGRPAGGGVRIGLPAGSCTLIHWSWGTEPRRETRVDLDLAEGQILELELP